MAINDFRLKIKTTANDQKIINIIESFMKGNVRLVNDEDGLKDLYKHDSGSMGNVNQDDYISLKNVFVMDSIRNKGIDLDSITSKEEKMNLLQTTNDEIINNLNSDADLVLSTKGVLNGDDSNNLNHAIILNVKADDFITVLSSLYESLKFRELDDVRIVTPTVSTIKYGFSRTILIKCNSKDLEYTVDMIEGLNQDIIDKCREVPVIYPSYNGWFGYETEDKEKNLNSTVMISKIIYDSIKDTIDQLAKNEDLQINNEKLSDYIENTSIKPFAYKDILNAYKDKVIPVIIEVFKDKLGKNGINLANIYELPNVTEELNSIYGSIDYSTLFDSAVFQNEVLKSIEKESIVKVPVKFDLPDEVKSMENNYSEALEDEAYLDSLLENFTPTELPVQTEIFPTEEVAQEEVVNENAGAVIDEEIKENEIQIPDVEVQNSEVQELDFSTIPVVEPIIPDVQETPGVQETDNQVEDNSQYEYEEVEVEVDPDYRVKGIKREIKHFEIPEFLKKDKFILDKVQNRQTPEENGFVLPVIHESSDEEVVPVALRSDVENETEVVNEDEIISVGSKPLTEEINKEEVISVGSKNPVDLTLVTPEINQEVTQDVINQPEINDNTPLVEPTLQQESENSSDETIKVAIPGDELTDTEIASVVSDATLTEEYSKDYSKYELFVDDINKLSLNVKSTDLTVYDYFEKYGLLDKMESTDLIELHPELGEPVDPKTFISNNLIDYLTKNGSGDLDYVIGLYASGIKKANADVKKRTLFPNIFKK